MKSWVLFGISFFVGLVISVSIVFFFVKSPKDPSDNKLLVGISADFPPFSFIEKEGYVGFDIDLAMLIAKELKREVIFKNMPFASLLPALQLKQIEAVIGSLTPTPERSQKVLFSDNYIDNDSFVIVSLVENKKESLADLKGGTVIVNVGYSADRYVEKLGDIFTVQRLKSPTDAFLALKNKIGDAFITAKSSVIGLAESEIADLFHIQSIENTVEAAAIGFHKENVFLRNKVNEILEKFSRDGTLEKLKIKWNLSL